MVDEWWKCFIVMLIFLIGGSMVMGFGLYQLGMLIYGFEMPFVRALRLVGGIVFTGIGSRMVLESAEGIRDLLRIRRLRKEKTFNPIT